MEHNRRSYNPKRKYDEVSPKKFKRRISFSDRKSIREFTGGENQVTIWHSSYEELEQGSSGNYQSSCVPSEIDTKSINNNQINVNESSIMITSPIPVNRKQDFGCEDPSVYIKSENKENIHAAIQNEPLNKTCRTNVACDISALVNITQKLNGTTRKINATHYNCSPCDITHLSEWNRNAQSQETFSVDECIERFNKSIDEMNLSIGNEETTQNIKIETCSEPSNCTVYGHQTMIIDQIENKISSTNSSAMDVSTNEIEKNICQTKNTMSNYSEMELTTYIPKNEVTFQQYLFNLTNSMDYQYSTHSSAIKYTSHRSKLMNFTTRMDLTTNRSVNADAENDTAKELSLLEKTINDPRIDETEMPSDITSSEFNESNDIDPQLFTKSDLFNCTMNVSPRKIPATSPSTNESIAESNSESYGGKEIISEDDSKPRDAGNMVDSLFNLSVKHEISPIGQFLQISDSTNTKSISPLQRQSISNSSPAKCEQSSWSILEKFSLNKTSLSNLKINFELLEKYKNAATISNVLKAHEHRTQLRRQSIEKNETASANLNAPSVDVLFLNKWHNRSENAQCENETQTHMGFFPICLTIDLLIENRFKTEKWQWQYDSLQFTRGQLKFRHCNIPSAVLVVNFPAENFSENMNKFGVIFFSEIKVVQCPIASRNWSTDNCLRHLTLVSTLPLNLKNYCSTSTELFPFLSQLEATYQQCYLKVTKLRRIVSENYGHLYGDENSGTYIFRRIFNRDTRTQLEITIKVDDINTIGPSNVSTMPLCEFDASIYRIPVGLEFLTKFLTNPKLYLL